MQTRKKIVQSVALAMGLMGPLLAFANPQDSGPAAAPVLLNNSMDFNSLAAGYSLLDLPPVLARLPLPVLVAQAGSSLQGLVFDASQISPLGDPAWVASLRGPDPSRPALNIGNIEATVPRSGTGEKDRIPDGTFRRGDSTVRNGQVLNNGRVFLIGAERSTLGKAGSILLAPGRAAELGDLRVPFVRVYVTAPSGTSLDVDRLVSQRPAIGMFNALFAPVPVRKGESGETAVASANLPGGAAVVVSMKAQPAGMNPAVVATAPVAERSVALLPLVPAQVEERVLIAYMAPIEDRSGNIKPIPAASVEERSSVAFIVPVEDRSGLLASIPAASVEERSFVAFVVPIEDRSRLAAAIPPAAVAERGFASFVPAVEERSGMLASIPPASVEERSFVAIVPVVEDRSMLLAAIPPATVEERGFVAFAAPVVDKAFVAKPLIPAPMEERVPVRVARLEPQAAPVQIARIEIAPLPLAVAPAGDAAQIASMGKPVPGSSAEAELVAAKSFTVASSGMVQVAMSAPVVVVAARADMVVSSEPVQAPVKLAAVQKRLPSVMIDRKGGFFFM